MKGWMSEKCGGMCGVGDCPRSRARSSSLDVGVDVGVGVGVGLCTGVRKDRLRRSISLQLMAVLYGRFTSGFVSLLLLPLVLRIY